VNYERWLELGQLFAWGKDSNSIEEAWLENAMYGTVPGSKDLHTHDHVVVIDALFGIGLTRPIDDAGFIVQDLNSRCPDEFDIAFHVVSIDVPSGLCANSGRILRSERFGAWSGEAVSPDLTVTFQAFKVGHLLDEGPKLSSKVVVKDIGLREQISTDGIVLAGSWRFAYARSGLSKAKAHKYSHGHALILSGPSGCGGAARLAARGALRIGAGVVTVGCPPDAIPENAARMDAVMLRGVADGEALVEALADPRINAVCVGPGLGLDARGREVVAVALKWRAEDRPTGANVGRASDRHTRQTPANLVLDADALTVLSQNPDLFAALHEGCVLTPHAGEFARLFPDIAERLAAPATKGPAYSKVDATREAATRAGCVVLYKGPDTVIADPSGRCAINSAHYDRAAPWLATAGSGDVLSGFITGLLARGFSPFDAACTGAWLHVECARSFGPGLIAEDLPEELPKVFRALGQ
jgi:hydroxyethylthiazole kinase-like uncharacterized protein yjeF